jgi:hypothetical protein
MWVMAFETSPVPASPLERIIAAPSVMRRSASPRLVAPHTNGTVKPTCRCGWRSRRGEHLGLVDVVDAELCRTCASTKWPMRALAITGIETASMMPSIMSGSLIRETPPWARMSAGTRSSAMTATAPASSAIFACSA